MAGPGGKEVGRLNLKVLPDTTQFGVSLNRYVKRIERQVSVRLNVEISDKAVTRELTQLQTRLEVQRPNVNIDTELTGQAGVRTAMAALLAELRVMTRAARPTISPNVSQVGVATAAVGGLTDALGSSAAGSSNVGRQIALWGPLIIVAAVAIMAIGPALAALLPLIAGIGFGIGAIALGFEQLKPLADPIVEAFAGMRKEVGRTLAEGLLPLVRTFASEFVPVLKDGFVAVAGLINDATTNLLEFLNSSTGLSLTADFLDAMVAGLKPLTRLLAPLTEVFLRLSTQAGPALEMMSSAIVRVTEDLAGWLSATDTSETISQSMRDLGGILTEIGQLIRDLFGPLFAAAPAVIAMLDGIGEVLGAVFLALTPVFEYMSANTSVVKVLAGAFAGVAIAVASVLAVAAVVGLVFASSASLIGAAIGAIVGAIIVLYNEFEGVRAVVDVVAQKVGAAFSAMAGVASSAFQSIAGNRPLLIGIATVITAVLVPALVVLGVQAAAAAARSVAAFIAMNVGAAMSAAMHVASLTLIGLSWVRAGVQAMASAIRMAAAWLIALGPIGLIIIAIAAVVAVVVYCWQRFEGFRNVVLTVFAAIMAMVAAWWQVVQVAFSAVVAYVKLVIAVWQTLFSAARTVFTFVGRIIATQIAIGMAALRAVGGVITSVIGFFVRLQTGVNTRIAAVLRTMSELPGRITSALGNLGSLLLDAGKAIIRGLIDGIESMIGAVRDKLSSLTDLIPDWKGPMSRDRVLLVPTGAAIIDGLISGIASRQGALKSELSTITDLIEATSMGALEVPSLTFGGAPDLSGSDFEAWARELGVDLPPDGSSAGGGGGDTYNVYPSEGMDEDLLAESIGSRVAWRNRR